MLTEIQGLLSKTKSILLSEPKKGKAKPKVNAVVSEALGADEARCCLEVAASLLSAGALQSKAQIDGSTRLVRALGLPSHHDRQKDWDSLKVLHYILSNTDVTSPILDAGSGSKSVILNWLNRLGYTNLHACDRVPVKTEFYTDKKIEFTVQDLAALKFKDGQFASISCVSVIEHGVDLDKFFSEMARLLKPGGWLLVSTDYWPEKIDCTGIYPYGEENGEMKVFNRADAKEILSIAKKHGLEVEVPVELEAKEKPVRWSRVCRDYTFLFLPLRLRR